MHSSEEQEGESGIIVTSALGLKRQVFQSVSSKAWYIVPAGTQLPSGTLEVHCYTTLPRTSSCAPEGLEPYRASPLAASWQLLVNLVRALWTALRVALR